MFLNYTTIYDSLSKVFRTNKVSSVKRQFLQCFYRSAISKLLNMCDEDSERTRIGHTHTHAQTNTEVKLTTEHANELQIINI